MTYIRPALEVLGQVHTLTLSGEDCGNHNGEATGNPKDQGTEDHICAHPHAGGGMS
jgi:hypothetical protein